MDEKWSNYIFIVLILTLVIGSLGLTLDHIESKKTDFKKVDYYLDLCLDKKNQTGTGVGFSVLDYDIDEECKLTKLR